MTNLPVNQILAATATSILPLVDSSTVPFFRTAVGFPELESVAIEKTSDVSFVGQSLLLDFEIKGWFFNEMPIPGCGDKGEFIRFKREPAVKLKVSSGTNKIAIPDWGVEIDNEKFSISNLRVAVVRQYLMLADKARRQNLSVQERTFWKKLLADSDYGDFCQRLAPAVRDTGKRVSSDGDGVSVVWSSGEKQTVSSNFAEALSIVNDGEEFSARVKFVDNELVSLAEVVPLGKSAPVDLDDLFGVA